MTQEPPERSPLGTLPAEPRQQELLLELLADGRELLLDEEQSRKVFTAEHLERNRARFDAILRCLGEGMSLSAISRAFEVSRNTLAALISRRPELVEQERRLAAGRFAVLARACSERLLETVDTMQAQAVAITMGIATEKSLLLDGRPTAISSTKRDGATPEQVAAYLDGLVSAAKAPVSDSPSDVITSTALDNHGLTASGDQFADADSGRAGIPGQASKGGGGGAPAAGRGAESMGPAE